MRAIVRTGIVADDLTGAGDTGVQFAKQGWGTYIFSSSTFIKESEVRETRRRFANIPVLVVNTQSRNISSPEAYRRVRIAFSLIKDREVLYKKVDSSLRGNIGIEIDAAMDATRRTKALFAAAYPEYGRVTVGGVHYIGKEAISLTEANRDPKRPVFDSQVSRIIARQSRRKVVWIDNRRLTGDITSLAAQLEKSFRTGNQILSCDAALDQDLESLARVALDKKRMPLLVGSAGLAAQVARLLPGSRKVMLHTESSKVPDGAVLVVSGSASAKNEAQLRYLGSRVGACSVALSPNLILKHKSRAEQEAKTLQRSLGRSIEEKQVLVLAIQQDAARQYQPELVAEVSHAFVELIADLLVKYRSKVSGLVLTGGDTAEQLLGNLGARGIWLITEVQPGVPIGLVDGGDLEGMPVITKAGALGREDTLALCAQYLANHHRSDFQV